MTNDQDNPSREPMLSEDDARRVLARAAELDAQESQFISESSLRQVAGEARLDPQSVDRALADLRAGRLVPNTRGRQLLDRIGAWRRPIYLALYMAAAFATPGDAIATTIVVTLALVGLFESSLRALRSLGGPPRSGAESPSVNERAHEHRDDAGVSRRLIVSPASV